MRDFFFLEKKLIKILELDILIHKKEIHNS